VHTRSLTNEEHRRYKCASQDCARQADWYCEAGKFDNRVGSYFCTPCKVIIQSMAVTND